jgi:hypothetical protein
MTEGLLFLKPLHLDRDGTCSDGDVREGKQTVERTGVSISTFLQADNGSGALNDRAPSPVAGRGYAPTRAKAMLNAQAPLASAGR